MTPIMNARRKVFLHDFHLEKNGKMVNFAGFEMPLQYSDMSISESHKHTREHVSVFDVSHMMQTKITGTDRIQFMESLVVADVDGLKENQSTLTLFTTENGGIIDDLIVTKTDTDHLYVVSNAGCAEKDLKHMQSKKEEFKRNGGNVEIEVLGNRALLAVQGPGMAKVLQPFVECNLSSLTFMTSIVTSVCGVDDCRITRCGYTGEDGVEISIPCDKSRLILTSLLDSKLDDVRLAGLGARDTLRLEASLCLYGNDITEDTTPIEASLAWTISKKRREKANFPGASVILQQLKDKPKRKRVGFVSTGPCPRNSCKILNAEGNEIGEITSGCPSPCLNKNISMGYIETASSKIGTKVNFLVHKKKVEGVIVKMPFVPTKYYIK
ncbi:aminomethyltransferase, mitochondrial-like [Uloborus diversus]|uniref:aminomethyltransferase, mitochondrial-like n=1 Tax=Uloborus diversus TaxID=327109 RepID=UPI002409CC56|nr:aminomethyltransferase, mitochondrial-like [Uloborus diversus]